MPYSCVGLWDQVGYRLRWLRVYRASQSEIQRLAFLASMAQ